MFNNPNTRASSSSKKSNTPEYNKTQKIQRMSQSQSKPQNIPIVTSNILAPISQQLSAEKPFYIGKGNNGEIITRVLSRRKGWKQVGATDFAYFRWIQNGLMFKYHLLGKECYCFNHFEYQRELSNKQRLVKNMVNFCEANKMNAYNFIPVSFILDLNTGEQDLALHGFVKFFNRNYPQEGAVKKNQSIILPKSKYIPYLTAQQLNKRSQGNFYCKPICPKSFFDDQTKSYLWILKPTFLNRGRGVVLFRQLQQLQKLIWKYYEGEGLEDYGDKFPHPHASENMTDSISQNVKSKQNEENQKKVADSDKKFNESNKFPKIQTKSSQQNEKQGKQKEVSLKKIENFSSEKSGIKSSIQDQYNNSSNMLSSTSKQLTQPRCLSFIIQKYIEKPMLIEAKKFDIRVWVLLTHTLQFYIFSEAYLRFSSQPYSTKDSHLNPFVHLTNNSVQKYCNSFDKSSGNQWLLSDIQKYLLPQNKSNAIYKAIIAKIKEIICLSMYSVRRKINVNSRKQCFELFGYDFMIDADNKVWLIEVNTNPAIQQASPLLKVLLPRMIDDMFKLTIDKIFNCKFKDDLEEFHVDGHDNDVNMWELLGDLKQGVNDKNGKRFTFVRR